jgi:sugar/nucleoside kinase (ribokinase family)
MLVRGAFPEPIELVAIGHLTLDRVSGETRLGGSAAYAAVTARRLGVRTGIVTSVGEEFPYWGELAGIEIHYRESEWTTEFENLYRGGERTQRLLAEAEPLDDRSIASIRPRLAEDAAVLYCPVVHEVLTPLVPLSPRGLCAVAPQGFFRRWDSLGHVSAEEWAGARSALARVDFVSMSEEDAVAPEELAEDFTGRAFAVTKGASGSRVYSGADVYDFPAPAAREVDPTGAGDVFAAAFLVALREKRPVPLATRFAASAASLSVEGPGLASIAGRDAVERRAASGGAGVS